MNYFLFLIVFYFITSNSGEPSKLVQIACSRNPTLSFCDDDVKAKDKGDLIQPLPDLPTFQEELIRTAGNLTLVKQRENKLDSSLKNETSGNFEESEMKGIPDDPILEEPLPDSFNQSERGNKTSNSSESEKPTSDSVKVPESSDSLLVTPPPLPETIAPGVPKPTVSNAEVVEVYITKFCVDNRKNFIVKCRRSAVNPDDLEFCKSYPLNCQSNEPGVIPILAYCEQFIGNYVKICNPTVKRNKKGKEFCKAYDQFCVPPPTHEDLLTAKQDLVQCESIVNEARKVCNPFPQPSDRLNHIRCTQFFKFCGKFVDWL